ncbi:relaxase/mobilization nuclease domain-containing protein [Prevotella lacticifex]|uniref:MobA/VirD2-like nuclease domain-containing protein n=1 Tax=Prevotella lacticifex TaxID=2854755 RepID=A0A9R1C7I5_9BACT|nr:relaxase/mobilization nuclease domain-containing protein [Prevotella lacticifex]GJG37190.1 hypothetical protein PRLR5003_23470 [Prevotella lacticifex]GJG40310.1 hypothetical protein PRLR5019_22810 [Prevotella lacticifex]GJG44004.1 hypothetical protein PRLR5025_27900 [Prevotella lacticifex]GJG46688.1 hypothetical protein PRLR5027_22830 [Prevotella lacticifex]GJG50692.1 hypothetical protein PRLR5052_31050 [Prevotella lacticifex]
MIITILPSSTTFHAIAYNEKKVEKGQASLTEAANIGLRQEAYTADNLREYFKLYSARNTRIQNTQFHVAVSCKGNEYSYEQLLDIAHRYLKEMGYAEEGQPLLVYAHRDTPNNHIHIITSRVAPDGHRISDKFEKRRSREACERIMQEYHSQQAGQNLDGQQSTSETANTEVWNEALSYRYTSKAQFYAILESMGYDCKEDEQDYSVSFYKNSTCQGKLSLQEILRHANKENRPDNRRRQQLRAILQKYRNLSANKEELAAHMKRKFGISLVFVGKADNPYGYILVDHKNKTVYKGGEFLSIRELLQFEDAATRFAKIEKTIDELLVDNPKLTTMDINRILYRQFGTRIHRGTVSWNGETINLRGSVVCQLHDNYLESKGIAKKVHVMHPQTEQKPHQSDTANARPPMDSQTGSKDANREYEVGNGMNVNDIDDEQNQQSKWRR